MAENLRETPRREKRISSFGVIIICTSLVGFATFFLIPLFKACWPPLETPKLVRPASPDDKVCVRQAKVVEIQDLPESDTLKIARVQWHDSDLDLSAGAVFPATEEIKIGDTVEMCYVDYHNGPTSAYLLLIYVRPIGKKAAEQSNDLAVLKECIDSHSDCTQAIKGCSDDLEQCVTLLETCYDICPRNGPEIGSGPYLFESWLATAGDQETCDANLVEKCQYFLDSCGAMSADCLEHCHSPLW